MIYILFFLLFTFLILTHSEISLYYAFHGLTIWYQKMVPSLLPFMILSGTIVKLNLTESVVSLFHPLLGRIYRCNPNVSYGILMGFLCGFPMGARTAGDLLREEKINISEARFLMAFANNIGPVYFLTFVIPTLQITNLPTALMGMYGIPIIYGIFLRNTFFRKELDIIFQKKAYYINKKGQQKTPKTRPDLLTALDEAVRGGISSISLLCGYMILFNLLNLLPHLLLPDLHGYIAPILEITGGILLKSTVPVVYFLILLSFGGLSCMAQTKSMIYNTGLSIREYTLHKLVLTGLTALYYGILVRT